MAQNYAVDYAHERTDRELEKLESRIATVYNRASKEMSVTINDYFAKLEKRDAAQLEKLNNGEITEKEYMQWRLNQIGRGERYMSMRDKLAERMTNANEVAVSYVNDLTPSIYSLNRNYAAYTIEGVHSNVSFDLVDEATVRRLVKENPKLMPNYPKARAVDRGIDLTYGKQQIMKQVTSGILQGKSIANIAKDLRSNITNMGRVSAIRTARTATTAAENAGRIDTYKAAEEMGIKLEKQWLATLDSRTRETHAALDGVHIPNDDTFDNGCDYPGDPDGPPEEVYNCRCTLIAYMPDVTASSERRARSDSTGKNEVVQDMSYKEWENEKRKTSAVLSSGSTSSVSKMISDNLGLSAGKQLKRYTLKELDKMSRSQLISIAKELYINNAASSGLTKAEAEKRFNDLISSNSNTSLKKYIRNHQK